MTSVEAVRERTVRPAPMQPSLGRRLVFALAVVGVLGWVAVVGLAVVLLSKNPPQAGFDLQLVLDAGRRVAEGQPLYAGLLAAAPGAVRAVDLFYAYPPVVAQAFSLVAHVPSLVVFGGLGVLAVAGTGVTALRIARTPALATATLALLPFVFPFTVALLFGNLDMFYPLVTGLLVLVALGLGGSGTRSAAGGALGTAALVKIHPGSLGLWALVRALRGESRRRWLPVVIAAAVAAVVLVTVSLVVGGTEPWIDYLSVVRSASGVGLVDSRNLAPAAQLSLAFGLGDDAARALYFVVAAAAVAGTVAAAWRVTDELVSLATAVTLSLVTLPITWFHYAAALLPIAVAAIARSSDTPGRSGVLVAVGLALVVGIVSAAAPVTVWIAIGAVLVAAYLSGAVAARSTTARASA